MITTEVYKIVASLVVECPPPVATEVLGKKFPAKICLPHVGEINADISTALFSVNNTETNFTTIEIQWEFCELFSDESYEDGWGNKTTLLSESKKHNWLFLPTANGNFAFQRWLQFFPVLYEIVYPIINMISVNSINPNFLESYRSCMNSYGGTVSVSVKDNLLKFGVGNGWGWGHWPTKSILLSDKKFSSILQKKRYEYEFHVSCADSRLFSEDLRVAITNLATAMEVACYEMLFRES